MSKWQTRTNAVLAEVCESHNEIDYRLSWEFPGVVEMTPLYERGLDVVVGISMEGQKALTANFAHDSAPNLGAVREITGNETADEIYDLLTSIYEELRTAVRNEWRTKAMKGAN